MWDLQHKYHETWETIRGILTKNGVRLRTFSENKSLPFNRAFFKQIDSHEKAYWLGFLYADGNVHKSTMQVQIMDEGHLDRFKAAMNAEQAVIVWEEDKYRFAITSDELIADLARLGVTPRKSLTVGFPSDEQVPTEYINSFMLGYFDGDGSIQLYQPKVGKRKWNFGIIGTFEFCDAFNQILIRECGLFENKPIKYMRIPEKNIWELHVCGVYRDRLERIYRFLYRDYQLPLARKRDVILDVIATHRLEPYTSQYYGVSWHKAARKWVAQKKVNRVSIKIGFFVNEIDAAKAYDAYIRANNHDLRTVNFPNG